MTKRPQWYHDTVTKLSKANQSQRADAEIHRTSSESLKASRTALGQTNKRASNQFRETAPEVRLSSLLDETMLRKHLAQAQGHAEAGTNHIAGQEHIIKRLRKSGLPTADAERLLTLFRETQELHLADCDRLSCILLEKGMGQR